MPRSGYGDVQTAVVNQKAKTAFQIFVVCRVQVVAANAVEDHYVLFLALECVDCVNGKFKFFDILPHFLFSFEI